MLVPVENEDHSFRQVKAGTSHEPVLSFAFRAGHISGYFAAVNPKHHLVQAVGAAREGERQDYGRQHPARRRTTLSTPPLPSTHSAWTIHPFRYSPSGCVDATGWSRSACNSWRSLTFRPALRPASTTTSRNIGLSTAPEHENRKANPPGARIRMHCLKKGKISLKRP